MASGQPRVAIIMGSDSDLPTMSETAKILEELDIEYTMRISSAHRTPKMTAALAEGLEEAGIEVAIVGAGLAAHLPGVVDFPTSLDRMADAKVVLNILPNFPQGPHDRCFSAMLNGAVAASDANRYLQSEFKNGSEILLFDWQKPDSLAETLTELLANPDEWQTIADKGRSITESRHTWTHRAEAAINACEAWLGKSF